VKIAVKLLERQLRFCGGDRDGGCIFNWIGYNERQGNTLRVSLYAQKACADLRKHPTGIPLCTKSMCRSKETPYGYPSMHKKHVQIKERSEFVMSDLQKQAVQMISGLSDDNIRFLIEIIQRLMPQQSYAASVRPMNENAKMRAFMRLEDARAEIKKYLPEDFDQERELEEARAERYGNIS